MVQIDKRTTGRLSPMRWVAVLVSASVVMVGVWYGSSGVRPGVAALPPSQVVADAASTDAMSSPPAGPAPDTPSTSEADSDAGLPLSVLPGEQLATDLAAQYSQPDQALLESHQGRRLRLLGHVQEQQVSATGVTVLLMDTGQGLPPLRMVMAQGDSAGDVPPAGQAATLACVHGGMVMGEPLLRDCRVVRVLHP